MAVSLQHRAALRSEAAQSKPMPKGPGVHMDTGGNPWECWLFDGRRKTPMPAPDADENDKPTLNPPATHPLARRREELRFVTRGDVDEDDLPTYGPRSKTTPVPETANEEKILDTDGAIARTTNSFAPPPPVSIPDMGEVSKLEEEGTSHKIIAKWKPKRKERTGIAPRHSDDWSIENILQDAVL